MEKEAVTFIRIVPCLLSYFLTTNLFVALWLDLRDPEPSDDVLAATQEVQTAVHDTCRDAALVLDEV